MFKTFNQFLKAQYEERCESSYVKALYQKEGGFNTFKKNYLIGHNFNDYLETLRGMTLTAIQTYHVAKMFFDHGDRKITEMPAILSSVCRYYNVELPVVYGILTAEYWESRFAKAEA